MSHILDFLIASPFLESLDHYIVDVVHIPKHKETVKLVSFFDFLSFLKKIWFFICMYVSLCKFVHCIRAGVFGGQQRASDPLDQELQAGESRVGAGKQIQAPLQEQKTL